MFRMKGKPVSSLPRNRAERGFSMIEIAIVLLVISIAAAFTIPQALAYMRAYRVGIAARDVATALQRARYIATSNNTRAGIAIAELQRINIEQYDLKGIEDPQNKGMVVLPQGITLDSDAPKTIAFDGRGVVTPLPKTSPTIRVNSETGYYAIVTVSATGQVTISDARRD
ncbi:MAG TPA: type II secretion system protein [Blastocatellia bacterium]|nr:type II secretion system protein [Blastocatellia bacterium]